MTQILINPRGVFRREEKPIAHRMDSLDKKVLGLVDNSKVNADVFLDSIQALLTKMYEIADVLRIRKSIAGTAAPFTEEFFEKCDIVVNAFGD
jgi:hypothetical protein